MKTRPGIKTHSIAGARPDRHLAHVQGAPHRGPCHRQARVPARQSAEGPITPAFMLTARRP